MAEAILGVVVEKLSSFIGKELGLLLGLNHDMEKLESMFTAIKATLQDAEEKQFSNEAVKNWLQKLKDAAHEVDDIMDECAYEELGLEYQGIKGGLSNKVQSSCLSSFHPKHVAFRHKIAKRMKNVSERLDQIAKEREQLHLTETVVETSGVPEWRLTTSFITEPQIYGREDDKNKVVDFLVGDASQFEDLLVYPIIGLGGLGKTALAQLIFNHERVVEHFELRIWICVSEDFSLKRMTKAIIEAISGSACEDLDLEPMQKKLEDLLQSKRYLLVLDDVWDDEQENWQRLKSVLACGAKGASVLLTTRLSTVATIMGTTPPLELSMLSDENCWELFKQRAFGPNEVIQMELEDIGKEIVKKCGGVPLAAKALGGLLRFERREEAWLNVKESNMWSSSHNIMPALRLSYLNLPTKLRQCFAYCAIFPKDERINKQYLIELWMANGFISSNGMLHADDVGDGLWHELHWRSLFQDLETDELGKVTSFKLHDLVHDLAQFVAQEICCIMEDNDVTSLSKRIRHLSDHRGRTKAFHLPEVKSLRTFTTPLNRYGERAKASSDVLKSCSLRVLDFVNRKKLSSSIGHLKHLRYLNLSDGHFKTLPESLSKLWNLQILKLDYCRRLKKLPNGLIFLKALQQLSLKGCRSLLTLPPHVGKLSSLRILSMYLVGKERGSLLAELGALKLKGYLHIKNLEKVRSVMDAKESNMSSKQLNNFLLTWQENEQSELQKNVEQIIEVLQPDTRHLQTLGVTGYKGVHFPQWMYSPSLINLNSLSLEDCQSNLHLPSLGKLPSLEYLSISGMTHVKYLYEESYDGGVVFMALKRLSLVRLPNLLWLSKEDGKHLFPRLSELEIYQCPKLLGLHSLPCINDIRIEGDCNHDLLSSIHKLSSLKSLQIGHNELTCFPDGMLQNLTSLKTLRLNYLSKLEVLPTKIINLDAIQDLRIHFCRSLNFSLQGLHMPSLKHLIIWGCCKFNGSSAGFQQLTCLEHLVIDECREVEGLHNALQHMTSLYKLQLINLTNLESLPDCFRNLPLLRHLDIFGCSKLRCLPTSLSLSSLQTLDIRRCPLIEKRCKKDTGEDWPKIAHIPEIYI